MSCCNKFNREDHKIWNCNFQERRRPSLCSPIWRSSRQYPSQTFSRHLKHTMKLLNFHYQWQTRITGRHGTWQNMRTEHENWKAFKSWQPTPNNQITNHKYLPINKFTFLCLDIAVKHPNDLGSKSEYFWVFQFWFFWLFVTIVVNSQSPKTSILNISQCWAKDVKDWSANTNFVRYSTSHCARQINSALKRIFAHNLQTGSKLQFTVKEPKIFV